MTFMAGHQALLMVGSAAAAITSPIELTFDDLGVTSSAIAGPFVEDNVDIVGGWGYVVGMEDEFDDIIPDNASGGYLTSQFTGGTPYSDYISFTLGSLYSSANRWIAYVTVRTWSGGATSLKAYEGGVERVSTTLTPGGPTPSLNTIRFPSSGTFQDLGWTQVDEIRLVNLAASIVADDLTIYLTP